ncbi:MAG: hypothetical protein KAT68_18555 [Bacteroidales bacterium]|nr:hypothetical protein [Bacteroidales bacterium]
MKILLKWIAIILILCLVVHIGLFLIFGGIDYSETFLTKYIRNDSTKTISTSHFMIETPKNWIHIFHGYGEEGEAMGTFLTKSGKARYEYGIFSNPFLVNSIDVFTSDSLRANSFKIYIAMNDI